MNLQIECPKCSWEPAPEDTWECHCGHVWNTFDTAARCPSCHHQHELTQCLSCHKMSPHLDWYKQLNQWLKELLESIGIKETV